MARGETSLAAVLPRLGLGLGWHDAPSMTAAIRSFTRGGGRMLDTAVSYRNHPLVREALLSSRIPRQDLFIVSKLDRKSVGRRTHGAIELVLRELGVSQIDLMLIHHPLGGGRGAATDRTTWQALVEAKQRGFCRFVGVSNIGIAGIADLTAASGHPPDALEVMPS